MYHFSLPILVHLCPVFCHHPFYTVLSWSVLGNFSRTIQDRRTAMEYAFIVLPNVWIVESLHAVVMPGTKHFICAPDWKMWRNGPLSTPPQVRAVPARRWRGVQEIRSGGHSAREHNGNHFMKIHLWKLMIDTSINYGGQVDNPLIVWLVMFSSRVNS